MSDQQTQLPKVSAKTAGEVAARFGLSDEARPLLERHGAGPVAGFFDALVAGKHHADAARLLAYALPRREAVWWALQCAREHAGEKPEAKVGAALAAVEAWVADPTEENRRACQPAYEGAELSTPAGCAALAAFVSGGSLAPPNLPAVPPADHLTAHAAAGAVILAAVTPEPAKAEEKYAAFLKKGVEAATRTDLFKGGGAAAAQEGSGINKVENAGQGAATPAATTSTTPTPGAGKVTLGGVKYEHARGQGR